MRRCADWPAMKRAHITMWRIEGLPDAVGGHGEQHLTCEPQVWRTRRMLALQEGTGLSVLNFGRLGTICQI